MPTLIDKLRMVGGSKGTPGPLLHPCRSTQVGNRTASGTGGVAPCW
jgi:hypothetical protein